MTRQQRILVTGLGGFSGRYLADFLAQRHPGFDVVGIGRTASASPRIVACDLAEDDTLDGLLDELRPAYVCHLAGRNHSTRPSDLFTDNVNATVNLLAACRRLDEPARPRILLTSSAAYYGDVAATHLPVDEAAPPDPVGLYGLSKVCQEHVAQHYVRAHGLPVIIARTFNVIGPGQPSRFVCGRIIEQFCSAAAGDIDAVQLGDLTAVRDFIDVRDVVAAYMALLLHGMPGAAYNVGSGHGTSIAEVVAAVRSMVPNGAAVEVRATRSDGAPRSLSVANIERLGAVASWRPRHTLAQSLEDMVAAHCAQAAG